jgi:hypothetical protein
VIVALSSAISLPNRSSKVPAPENDTALGVNARESAPSVAASAIRRKQTLTFADRVAYQRAIEEVYWQHRIWPKDNAGAKPPLDRVMPREAIEKKVEGYLGKSQLVADRRGWPITASELHAEMERMGSHTLHPRVLLELFGALDNDSFVIAECLARPLVAERLSTEFGGQRSVEAFAAANVTTLTAATALVSELQASPYLGFAGLYRRYVDSYYYCECARRALWPHGNMDRQRNDYMGRGFPR